MVTAEPQASNVHEADQPWFAEERRPALLELLRALDARQYDFVTATPATHTRVVRRPDRRVARTLRDVLGWSLPFTRDIIDANLFALLDAAGAITPAEGETFRALVRVSRWNAHSSCIRPTQPTRMIRYSWVRTAIDSLN